MRVIIMPAAEADLISIRNYIREQNPNAARRVGRRLIDARPSLSAFPSRGRPGLVSGTRENVTVWPYVIVYRVTAAEVQIVRVWHGAQDRPAE
jgi:toxin ParE1/3/4